MAQKECKELRCADCDFRAQAGTEDELVGIISEHACRVHQVCTITQEERGKMNSMAGNAWCTAEFVPIQEAGSASLRGEWMED